MDTTQMSLVLRVALCGSAFRALSGWEPWRSHECGRGEGCHS